MAFFAIVEVFRVVVVVWTALDVVVTVERPEVAEPAGFPPGSMLLLVPVSDVLCFK